MTNPRVVPVAVAMLMLAFAPCGPPSAAAQEASLRFFGWGNGDVDRVKIRIDAPAVPADVGAGSFTLEFWMKALPGENGATGCAAANDGWIYGNIVFDRDVYGPGDWGDYGISLFTSGLAFGVYGAGAAWGAGICGGTPLDDGAWHHVAATRRATTGEIRLYVDGTLDSATPGPAGNASYRDNRPTSWPDSDPYLVIGAEKHDAGPSYPSFSGWVDEVRLSNSVRYSGNFPRPAAPFAPDSATVALYHFDEAAGDSVHDSSVAPGGPSHGVRRFGGSPGGPQWSSDTPFGPAASVRGDAGDALEGGATAADFQAHPNPFRATVLFSAPCAAGRGSWLDIMDARGRVIARLMGEEAPGGGCSWAWSPPSGVPPGVYFARATPAGAAAPGGARVLSVTRLP